MSGKAINFHNVVVKKLNKDTIDVNKFKCSKQAYEEYIKKDAFDDQEKAIGQTWLFVHEDTDVIGYVTIAMADLNKNEHEKFDSFPHSNIPGILIGQLATHQDFERMGVGTLMLDWVIKEAIDYSKDIGCRVVYLNPEEDVIDWYKKYGFLHIQKKKKQDIMFINLR